MLQRQTNLSLSTVAMTTGSTCRVAIKRLCKTCYYWSIAYYPLITLLLRYPCFIQNCNFYSSTIWWKYKNNVSEIRPALVTADHIAIVVLKVTNTSRDTSLVIIIVTFICTRSIWVLALRYNCCVARHIFDINKCRQIIRHSWLGNFVQQSGWINCIVVVISL